jgi:hypothetical protein
MFTGQQVPAETRQRLVDRADGNPLYAEELARMVNETGPAGLEDLSGSHEFAARVPILVRAALAAGHAEAGAALADLLVPLLPMREYSAATAHALLAEDGGDRAAAAEGFTAAAAGWGAFGNELERAHALLGLHHTAGDAAALTDAQRIFTEMGAASPR